MIITWYIVGNTLRWASLGPCENVIMSTTPHTDVSSSVTCSEDEVMSSSEESIPQTETTPRPRERRQSAKSAAPLAKRLACKLSHYRTSTPRS